MPRSYERVEINGRPYLVCAMCRRPLVLGHNPLYEIVADNILKIGDPRREAQALCGPDYKMQWREVYPDTPLQSNVVDGFLDLTEVSSSLLEELKARGINVKSNDNLDVWELAIEAARASGGGETVAHAYQRLSEAPGIIDVEISAPVDVSEEIKSI